MCSVGMRLLKGMDRIRLPRWWPLGRLLVLNLLAVLGLLLGPVADCFSGALRLPLLAGSVWLDPRVRPKPGVNIASLGSWAGITRSYRSLRPLAATPFGQAVPAAVVSHTAINVIPPPWDAAFEVSWTPPAGALGGSLLRGADGQYVAEVEWASLADCRAWLHSAGAFMDFTRQSTGVFERRPSESVTSRIHASATAASPSFKVEAPASSNSPTAAAAVTTTAFLGRSLASTPWGSSGEEPDMDEDTELLYFGGDATFLDDSLWGDRPLDSKGGAPSASSAAGTVGAADEEWDGVEDDSAHFD